MTERRWFALACIVIAIGTIWRVYRINAFPGLDPDEVEGALAWFRDGPILWYVYPSGRPHLNPLAPLVLFPFAALGNPAAWVVRMPAVIAGIALLPAIFFVTRRTFGHPVAVTATVFASTMPILVAYSRPGWDLAYVPVVTAIVLGFAFAQKLIGTGIALGLLALVHPTVAFVAPIAAAPFLRVWWIKAGAQRHSVLWRTTLAFLCVLAFASVFVTLAAFAADIPMTPAEAPRALALVGERLVDSATIAVFITAFWQALGGTYVYAEFAGGHVMAPALWPGIVVLVLCAGTAFLLRREGKTTEMALVIALPCALLAQYVSMGTDEVSSPLKERYFLWSAVPCCWALAFLLHAVGSRLKMARLVLPVALLAGILWLGAFYLGYFRPFEKSGGLSASLDYRTAIPQPKVRVLEIVGRERRYPETVATVFVGEARLELVLTYLASRDRSVRIRNLGRTLYQHQRSDIAALTEIYALPPRDVFFVDYAWNDLPGEIREIHRLAARTPQAAVGPWTAREIARINTTGGESLLKVWRLSKD